jgi:hypothetical protein
MAFKRILKATLALLVTAAIALVGMKLSFSRVHADDENGSEAALVTIGLRIAPSFIPHAA